MREQSAKWYRLAPKDVVEQLHTDASYGLSRKEARSRYRKNGANVLFDPQKENTSSMLGQLFRDPLILLFLFAALLALLFSNLWEGLLAVGVFGACIAILWRYSKMETRMLRRRSLYRMPTVCVIRDGTRYLCTARTLVKGDVIHLVAGDLVPADCRLLHSKNLRVLTRFFREDGSFSWEMLPKNADRVYAYGETVDAQKAENMLYGGSEILAGEAYCVVTDTGNDCLLGGKEIPLGIKEEGTKKAQGAFQGLFRLYNLSLLVLLIPLTVIGCFTVRDGRGFFGVFFLTATLGFVGSQALLQTYFKLPWLRLQHAYTQNKREGDRAVIQTERGLERLPSIRHIFVMGRVGSSDGCLHLWRCFVGKRERSLSDPTDTASLQTLCEALSLWEHMKRSLPHGTLQEKASSVHQELLAASGFDLQAMQVRLERTYGFEMLSEENLCFRACLQGTDVQLLFSDRPNILSTCYLCVENGRLVAFGEQEKQAFSEFAHAVSEAGGRLRIMLRETDGTLVFLGALAMREQMQQELPTTLAQLRDREISVSFFLNESDEQARIYARETGLPQEIVCASKTRQNGVSLASLTDQHRILLGFDLRDIRQAMEELNRREESVMILTDRAEDLALYGKTTLFASAHGSVYRELNAKDGLIEENISPTVEQIKGSTLLRRRADILLGRANEHGGGLITALRLITESRSVRVKLSLLLRFLAATQLSRVVFLTVAICFGVGVPTAAQLLLVGCLLDAACGGFLLSGTLSKPTSHKREDAPAGDVTAWLREKRRLLPPILTCAILAIYCGVMTLCKVFSLQAAISFSFGCLSLLPLLILVSLLWKYRIRCRRSRALPVLLLVLAVLLMLTLLCSWISALQRVWLFGAWSLASGLSLLLLPSLFLAFSWLFSRK